MDMYHRRRTVSWIAHHVSRGLTWEEICAMNAKRRGGDRKAQDELDACRADGFQAVRNAELAQAQFERRRAAREAARAKGQPEPSFPPLRLCDIPGVKFPSQE